MELILYIILSWFVIAYFVIMLPKNDLVINIILYMLLLIFTVSITTVVYLNLEIIKFTEDKVKFVALALSRNIVTPLLLVIFSNIFYKLKTYTNKIISIILFLLLTSSMEFINLQFALYTFVKFDFLLGLIICVFFIFIALIFNKMLYIFRQRGELEK